MMKIQKNILLVLLICNSFVWANDFPQRSRLFKNHFYILDAHFNNLQLTYNKFYYREINKLVSTNILLNIGETEQSSRLATKISKDDNLFLSYKIFTDEIKYHNSYKNILQQNRIEPHNYEQYSFAYLSNLKFRPSFENQELSETFRVLDLNSEFGQKLMSNTISWVGFGTGMLGVLMLMPKSFTKWEDDFISDAKSNLNRAFSNPPVWDEDHWEINYIGHPVVGSFYYNALRSNNSTIFQSFVFSLYASTVWEYVFEGVAEQPSTQDLFVTPIVGAILGESIHQITLGMRKNGFSFFEKVFVTIFNPMYAINNGYK